MVPQLPPRAPAAARAADPAARTPFAQRGGGGGGADSPALRRSPLTAVRAKAAAWDAAADDVLQLGGGTAGMGAGGLGAAGVGAAGLIGGGEEDQRRRKFAEHLRRRFPDGVRARLCCVRCCAMRSCAGPGGWPGRSTPMPVPHICMHCTPRPLSRPRLTIMRNRLDFLCTHARTHARTLSHPQSLSTPCSPAPPADLPTCSLYQSRSTRTIVRDLLESYAHTHKHKHAPSLSDRHQQTS
jgi:hypothetical protein